MALESPTFRIPPKVGFPPLQDENPLTGWAGRAAAPEGQRHAQARRAREAQ